MTKAEARKLAFAARKVAHAQNKEAAASALQAHLEGVRGRVIAGYLPIRTEADPMMAMEELAVANRLCVPVVDGPGQPLRFREWTPGCRLVEGAFKVLVPEDGAELVPDLVIVPMVAFNSSLYRLGYGGGFYDRTLEVLRAAGAVEAIGFAYSAQELSDLPLEPTDQPLDSLVTEKGLRVART